MGNRYNFEHHDDDGMAFLTLDNGQQLALRFLDNKLVVESNNGQQAIPFKLEYDAKKIIVDFNQGDR